MNRLTLTFDTNLRTDKTLIENIFQYSNTELVVLLAELPTVSPTFNWITPSGVKLVERVLFRNAALDTATHYAYDGMIYPGMTEGILTNVDVGTARMSLQADSTLSPFVKIPVDKTIIPIQTQLIPTNYDEIMNEINVILPSTYAGLDSFNNFSNTNVFNGSTYFNGNILSDAGSVSFSGLDSVNFGGSLLFGVGAGTLSTHGINKGQLDLAASTIQNEIDTNVAKLDSANTFTANYNYFDGVGFVRFTNETYLYGGTRLGDWFNAQGNILESIGDPINVRDAVNLQYLEGELSTLVETLAFEPTTGVITLTNYNGTTSTINLPTELIVSSGSYDSITKDLTLVLASGGEIVIPLDDILVGLATQTWVGTELESYYTQVELDAALADKVDVVIGKELSANDFTDILLTKLNTIEENAEVNDANTTLQGNTFNGLSQLVQLNASGQLPALDGRLLTDMGIPTVLTDLSGITINTPALGEGIFYNGSEWVNQNIQTIGAGKSITLYIEDTLSGVSGYELLSPIPLGLTEELDTAILSTANVDTLIASYATDVLGRTTIEAGAWYFDNFAKVSSTDGITNMKIKVYKYEVDTTETLLFEVETNEINATSIQNYALTSTQTSFTINATDRLVVKYYGRTNSVASPVITFVHSGTLYASRIDTPFQTLHNDLAGLQGGLSNEYFHLNSTQLTKLNGISIGAEVNVQSDWNAASGDALILNKPTVPVDVSDLTDTTNSIPSTTDDITEGTNLFYTDARADARVALLVDTAPTTLDTLNELAAALGDDPNFATTITTNLADKVDKVTGKALSTNDFTDTLSTKLGTIETSAEINILEGVRIGGTSLTPTSKAVDITSVPTTTTTPTAAWTGAGYKIATLSTDPATKYAGWIYLITA